MKNNNKNIFNSRSLFKTNHRLGGNAPIRVVYYYTKVLNNIRVWGIVDRIVVASSGIQRV
jgi:hypothetical protein